VQAVKLNAILNDVCGISIQKKFIPTKANMKDVSLVSYKSLKPRKFSYVTITSHNGGKISLAMNNKTLILYLILRKFPLQRSQQIIAGIFILTIANLTVTPILILEEA
jgi:hypothetical protein